MSESHLRTQKPKRLAEVTYGYKKEATACTNLTGQMQESQCGFVPDYPRHAAWEGHVTSAEGNRK